MGNKIIYDESLVEYGEGHGTPFNHFKNIYYNRHFIGRTYVSSGFLDYNESTEVYVPLDLTNEQLSKYGVICEDDRESNKEFLLFKNDEEGAIKALFSLLNDLGVSLEGNYIREGDYLI